MRIGSLRSRADHLSESVQGTSIPRRGDSTGSAMVLAISIGIRACRRATGGARPRGRCQLCLALGASLLGRKLNKRCRSHLKRTNKSYRVDETYVKVKGEDKYLYRAVDSTGHQELAESGFVILGLLRRGSRRVNDGSRLQIS